MNLSIHSTRPQPLIVTAIGEEVLDLTRPKRMVSALEQDRRLAPDMPLDDNERDMALVYWRTSIHQMVASAAPRPEFMVTKHGQCNGDCDDESPSSGLFRHVSNDIEKTREAFKIHLDMGLKLDCPKCSHRHLELSSALSYHAHMLECNKARDDHGALVAARRRCAILKGLGYKLA